MWDSLCFSSPECAASSRQASQARAIVCSQALVAQQVSSWLQTHDMQTCLPMSAHAMQASAFLQERLGVSAAMTSISDAARPHLLRKSGQALLDLGTVLCARAGVGCPSCKSFAGTPLCDAHQTFAGLQHATMICLACTTC